MYVNNTNLEGYISAKMKKIAFVFFFNEFHFSLR